MVIVSRSPKTTKKTASLFAKKVVKKPSGRGFVIGLRGNLGSGKSVFARGFAQGLGIRKRILSPTFLIMKIYGIKNKNYHALVHVDAYRIKRGSELKTIGFDKILREKNHITVIEWADNIKKILPKNTLWIDFKHGRKNNERIIKINGK